MAPRSMESPFCDEHKMTSQSVEELKEENVAQWKILETKISNKVFWPLFSCILGLIIAAVGWNVNINRDMERKIESGRHEQAQQIEKLDQTIQDLRLDVRETQVLIKQALRAEGMRLRNLEQ